MIFTPEICWNLLREGLLTCVVEKPNIAQIEGPRTIQTNKNGAQTRNLLLIPKSGRNLSCLKKKSWREIIANCKYALEISILSEYWQKIFEHQIFVKKMFLDHISDILYWTSFCTIPATRTCYGMSSSQYLRIRTCDCHVVCTTGYVTSL